MGFNHCRLCSKDSYDVPLFKYGVRHYVCAECGFKRWGDKFLDRLALANVNALPLRVCEAHGWDIKRLSKYVADRERKGEYHERRAS